MRKVFLILTIVGLLATLTIINAIPASAGTLTITPPVGGPEDPSNGQVNMPGKAAPPDQTMMLEIPEGAGEDLSGVAERNPILHYAPDPPSMPPEDPQQDPPQGPQDPQQGPQL
jgi:hypothetical protein